MRIITCLWWATVVAACASIPAPTADEAARIKAGRQSLDDAPDRAMDIAVALLEANPELRGARLLAAEASMRMARDSRFGRGDLHLQDAVRNLQRVLDADGEPVDPVVLVMLAECHYELGAFEPGSAAARRAVEAMQAKPRPEQRSTLARANLFAGRCDYRRFVASRQVELQTGKPARNGIVPAEPATRELAAAAARSFAAARREHAGEATTQIAAIQQWLGQSSEVVRTLEAGLLAFPEETSIHDEYIRFLSEGGQHDAMVGAYTRFLRERPDSTILRWHLGRAVYVRADRLRREGNFRGAVQGYERARAAFGDYVAQVPAHASAANEWLALCNLSLARCAVDAGDLETAAQALLRAGELSPLVTTYDDDQPRLTDSFGSHFTGTAFAIHAALAQSADDALARTLTFNEQLLQRWPERFGFVYNNAALAARDLGVQRAKAGDHNRARELWERSYRYYERALALMPDDPRLANDCGLMLVYHLGRDLDRARVLFDRAIEIGKRELAALDGGGDVRRRQAAEEVVGDALQNIAILLREHRGAAFADYRPFCEQAVAYYPYQRREAAVLLRTGGAGDLGAMARGGAAAASAAGGPQGGPADALQKVRAAVDQKVKAEDFDGALNLLDPIADQCREHAPFHQLRGEVTLLLANQARDSGRRGTELFYQDAVRALQRAVELNPEPAAPRQMLAEAQYAAGDAEAAANTLSALLLHLQSQGGGKPEEVLAAHRLRANAAARAYAQKKSEGDDDRDLLTAARTSLRVLEPKDELDLPMLQLWSATEQWAEAPAEAVNVYIRASERQPGDPRLIDAVVNTAAAQGQLPLAIEALAARNDPTTAWYLGRAQFLRVDAERAAGRADLAMAAIVQAEASFMKSMEGNPAYRDSCEQWLAMCLGKKGHLALAADNLADAEKWLLQSVRQRPDRIAEDLGSGESTKTGIILVADKHYRRRDLARVESIYRAAIESADSDLDLLNNAGLFARDLGDQLERDGKKDAARAMHEQSYKAYRRAQQLDPESVRLRNDCALIAIYHLERDWDFARQMLDSAIADGERILADDPPADAEDRQQLDEAVGDCYENLALWHLKHSKDGAAAKAAALQSQKHHPGQRRPGARRHLQAAERLLQGK